MASGKRVVLSMQQRLDVLKELETSSVANVAKKYKVHHATICRIQRNATTITNFANKGKLEKCRKNFKKPMYEELEQKLLLWFIEKRNLGDYLSDGLLLQKAAELKEELGSCSNFRISAGWLAKFKRRNKIRLVRRYGEKASADEDGANAYISDHKKFIKNTTNVKIEEDGNEERDEENVADEEEHGIKVNLEEREELDYVFKRLERYRDRIPRPARFHLDGLKLTFLGDTTSKKYIHSYNKC